MSTSSNRRAEFLKLGLVTMLTRIGTRLLGLTIMGRIPVADLEHRLTQETNAAP
ncbi:MAG TPA: hypothetical protein VJN91_09970 [Gammaproteobacteria bacterium]|nr:hypothetical protein [Gammaproteobacteria bacterium]